MKGDRDSMEDNAEDCPVCLTTFDDTIRRPRTLPCGHTFCTLCINGLKTQGQVTCPTCRLAHVVPKAGQFPVSYITETFMKKLRDTSLTYTPPKAESGEPTPSLGSEYGPDGLSTAIRSMLQEQEAKILAAISACQEAQAQLNHYQTTLMDWSEHQQKLEDRLQALVDQSKGARVLVRQEELHVEAKKHQVQQGEQQLHSLLQALRAASTRQEAFEAIDEGDLHTAEERQRVEECHRMFPDVHTVTTITRVREASSAALEAATTTQAESAPASDARDSSLPAIPESSITDRLKAMMTPVLKVENLRSLTHPARRLLQAGLVYGIHQHKERRRYSMITLEDGRQYLHALQDQPPPTSAVTVQVDELVPTPPCLVFMDLAWPGSDRRRVLIHLISDTPLGGQFVLLCTGQRGPCYANSRLWNVADRGQPGERVWGGDYEHNNGKGGAALLPDLDKVEYRKPCRAGDVFWYRGDPGALFIIMTRNWKVPATGARRVYGEVVSGLEGLVAAAQHHPITDVTVVDCGVVL